MKDQLGRCAAMAAATLVATACTGGTLTDSTHDVFRPMVEWSTCPDDVEVQFLQKHRCGFLTVLQDRAIADGARVRTFVVEVYPEKGEPSADPILVFGSDLGRPAEFGGFAPLASRTQRIVYLMEVRGVGHSQPSLECPEVGALESEVAATTIDLSIPDGFPDAVRACRDRLGSKGVDVGDFDVQAVADDGEDLRVALGYQRWNVASYGTTSRYLLQYLRDYGARHVRAAFMDSPQFPEVDEVTGGLSGTQIALDQLLMACGDDAQCSKAYPDLAASWSEALALLERVPLRGRIPSSEGGRTSVTIDAGAFFRVARSALGGNDLGNLEFLPRMVTLAAKGRLDPVLAAIAAGDPLLCDGYHPECHAEERFSLGNYLTVLCRDQAPFIDRTTLAAETAGDPTLTQVFGHHPYLAACEGWAVPPADPIVHEPVLTDVPLLILSGRFDSFSPPQVARVAAASFEHAWVVDVDDTHNILGHNECSLEIRNAWIDEPTSAPEDTGCLDDVQIEFSTKKA
jgi:pimeloyl-ACP methyl ester carboxylesterase